jgi:hypothetical protein
LQEIWDTKKEMGIISDETLCQSHQQRQRSITIDDMLMLYNSESYHLLDSDNHDIGDKLMIYIEEYFNKADTDSDGLLNIHDFFNLLVTILEEPPSNEETAELFDMLDGGNKGAVTREEFKSFVLKPNKNQDIVIPGMWKYC